MDNLLVLTILLVCCTASCSGGLASVPGVDDDDDGAVSISIVDSDNDRETTSGSGGGKSDQPKPAAAPTPIAPSRRKPAPTTIQEKLINETPKQILAQKVEFDGDNDDIDDYDFGLDDLDVEVVDIHANTIPPAAWVVIIDNFKKRYDFSKLSEEEIEQLHNDLETLTKLEKELVSLGMEDFDEREPVKLIESSRLEVDILERIQKMPETDQNLVLDVDGDGKADYSFL